MLFFEKLLSAFEALSSLWVVRGKVVFEISQCVVGMDVRSRSRQSFYVPVLLWWKEGKLRLQGLGLVWGLGVGEDAVWP